MDEVMKSLLFLFRPVSSLPFTNDDFMAPPTQSTNQVASNSTAAPPLRNAFMIKTPDCLSKCKKPISQIRAIVILKVVA